VRKAIKLIVYLLQLKHYQVCYNWQWKGQ